MAVLADGRARADGDRNSVLAGDDTIRKWADLIEQRARRIEQMDIQYVDTTFRKS